MIKIVMDPMPKRRAEAKDEINSHFNGIAAGNAHRFKAHIRKWEVAALVLDQGATIPDGHPFAQEAALRGLSVTDFAKLIASKPHAIDANELHRQKTLIAVEAAATPADIDRILDEAAIHSGSKA